MNRIRRNQLKSAIANIEKIQDLLAEAMEIIEQVKDEEEEAMDNVIEHFGESEQAQALSDNVDLLDSSLDELNDIDLETLIDDLKNI